MCGCCLTITSLAFFLLSTMVVSLVTVQGFQQPQHPRCDSRTGTTMSCHSHPPRPSSDTIGNYNDDDDDGSGADPSNSENGTSVSVRCDGSMRLVQNLREIVSEYDVFLLDMWGVLHDGSRPYPGVLETIQTIKAGVAGNKRLVVLSNSSKRQSNSIRMLTQLGFRVADFEQIITSGEVCHQLLLKLSAGAAEAVATTVVEEKEQQWESLLLSLQKTMSHPKNKVFVWGSGDDDVEYCESCGWTVVATVEDASLLLARGTFTVNDGNRVIRKLDDPEGYERALSDSLRRGAARRIPLLVANPDKIRPDPGRPPMPGQLGDRYEQALADFGIRHPRAWVKRIGKPFTDVYQLALTYTTANTTTKNSGPQHHDLSRICMVGDALETDVVGGSVYGIDTVWVVKDGIHGDDINDGTVDDLVDSAASVVEAFNEKSGTYALGRIISPTIVLPHFRW